MISGFHREVDRNWASQGYYTAGSCNSLPTFQDNLCVPSSSFISGAWQIYTYAERGLTQVSRGIWRETGTDSLVEATCQKLAMWTCWIVPSWHFSTTL